EGDVRTVTLGSGISLPERIVTNDGVQRRLQYRIEGGPVRHHLATLDVIDLGDGTCLAVYSTDAEPDVMALVVGAACGDALLELRRQLDDGERAA
ncbi:MAG: SRPBCC family protein, partial [Actinobacteria bacterium]|nr:SRPBCC family protein [Actinomycetota bacterium]